MSDGCKCSQMFYVLPLGGRVRLQPTALPDAGSVVVAFRGGLRVIDRPRPCHGYQNGCVCKDCREREKQSREEKPEPAPQPWEPRQAA